MEGLVFLFLIFGGWRLVVWLLRVGGGAVSDAAKGQASFLEGVQVRSQGMRQLELKVDSETVGEHDLPVWTIKLRGLFHVSEATHLGVITSIFDTSEEGNPRPILAAIDNFQEPTTSAFQFSANLGVAEPGQGFLHWVNVGTVPKDLLMYPYSGRRKISIVVRIIDQGNIPPIEWGFAPDHAGLNQQFLHDEYADVERGFQEHSDEDLGVAAASLRLGLALGFSDGGFDPLEGKVIKEWAAKFVNKIPEGPGREDAKEYVNDAIRYGSEDARRNDLSIGSQVEALNKLAGKPEKYAAMELCLDVMAADGSAEKTEIQMLNRLCESLGLDSDRFNELRDHRLMNVETTHVEGSNIWESLSINESLPEEDKLKELRKLYRRWNARAESLEDGQEREKAHQMLELITEARSLLNA